MNEQTTIRIPLFRLPEAEKALAKLVKKAQKYDSTITVAVSEPILVAKVVEDWDGVRRTIHEEMVDLVISGAAPRVGNHEFLAHIELGEAGNILDVRPRVTDLDTRFRHSDGYCEHCRTDRRRKDVYVVRDLDTGAQLQIGRSCLRDYMGLDDPRAIAAKFAFMRSVNQLGDEYERGFGGGSRFLQSLEGLVALAACCVRLFGWCSKATQSQTDVRATSSYVLLALSTGILASKSEMELRERIQGECSAADYETAKATIKWVREELRGTSDYEHNLRVIFAKDMVSDEKRVGIVVSAIAAYHRAVEKVLRQTTVREVAQKSQFVGEVGDRIRNVKVTLQMQRVIGSNDWGDKILVKLVDEDGNIYSWFTGKGTGLEIGEQALLTGTVKKHNVFNGVSETNLTRCSLLSL